MDYTRRIGKKESDTWPKLHDCVPQRPLNTQKLTTPLQEDRRLKNWKRWLADRERRQKYLAAALKREPIDLVLNAHERVRLKNETKCLIESADRTEVTNQDKYRGNPVFWRPEERLRKVYENDEENVTDDDVIVTKGKGDKFLPPEITRVALPAYIKKEKMLIDNYVDPTKINLNSKWNCNEYLKHRKMQLKREIKYLEPKQPETEDLIIIGQNHDCRKKEGLLRIPVITITPDESHRNLLYNPDDRAALKIQDREFVLESARHFEKLSPERTQELRKDNEELNDKKYVYAPFDCNCVYEIVPKKCKPLTWTLHFVTKGNEISERKFHIENRGVRVIHVEWRKATFSLLSISLPERVDSRFFFNKSRISILPGQKVEVAIWFRADRPVVAMETWCLIVDPKVYPGNLLLRLWATSCGKNYKLKQEQQFESVKTLLKCRAQRTTVREIIDDLLETATTVLHGDNVPYETYFMESDLFEARNPGYHYKSILANELKQMHADATHGQHWNLLLSSLKSILLKLENPIVRREKLVRFQTICHECLLPNFYYTRPKPSKEKFVYWLLCLFVNKFEDEDDYAMRCCCSEIITDDTSEELGGVAEMEDGDSEVFITSRNLEIYHEVMFIRIYYLLCETIDKICVVVESCDVFNK